MVIAAKNGQGCTAQNTLRNGSHQCAELGADASQQHNSTNQDEDAAGNNLGSADQTNILAVGVSGQTTNASTCVRRTGTEQTVSLTDIAYKAQVNNTTPAETTQTHTSPVSPPYMVGMVEIELDKLIGKVDIIDYMAVVDCGIPINPALATIQTEGGIVQGIGHTLMENVTYDHSGRPAESSFMQYKVPTRLDMGG